MPSPGRRQRGSDGTSLARILICMKGRPSPAIAWIALVLTSVACAGRTVVTEPSKTDPEAPIAELWGDPGEKPRDLALGVGGIQHAPPRDVVYTLDSRDDSGFSVSYDVA